MMRNWTLIAVFSLTILSGCSSTPKILASISGAETPFAKVLKMHPELKNELSSVEIRQSFNRVESPTVSEVRVIQRDLLDDSIQAIRITYQFKLLNGIWIMSKKQEEHQCARGNNTQVFQTVSCL